MRVAIIAGSGKGVWAERRAALGLLRTVHPQPVYIAVNGAGMEHPDPLHHWVSVHPDHLYEPPWEWETRRRAYGLGLDYTRWGVSRGGNVDRVCKRWKGGSSGLLALAVALDPLGCDAAILCGVPLDDRENEFTAEPWGEYERFQPAWTRWQHEFGAKARSMSGWTQQLLGRPTREWLLEIMQVAA